MKNGLCIPKIRLQKQEIQNSEKDATSSYRKTFFVIFYKDNYISRFNNVNIFNNVNKIK